MKNIICFILLTVMGFCLEAQAQSAKDVKVKLIEKIVGSWKIAEVTEGKSRLADNSTGISALEFSPDGKYRSLSKTEAIDSGSYRINENSNILYLESGDNRENPSEWNVSFKDNTMILKGRGQGHAQKFQYVYVRTKNGLSTNQQ